MQKDTFKRNLTFFNKFTSLELLTFAYGLLSAIYIILFYKRIEDPITLLLHRVVFFAIITGLATWHSYNKTRILEFIRLVFPLALITYWYPETYYLNHNILVPNLDSFFNQLDIVLFNSMPAMEFSARFPYPWLSELMYFSYFSFFAVYVYIGCLFFFKFRKDLYPVLFSILMSFFIFYIIFIFVPVQGPQFYWQYPDNQVPDGYFFCRLMRFTQSMGEKPTGAFPSSHVGMTLIYMSILFKYSRKSFYCLLPIACMLILSTVYIKAHYLVDIFGGLIITPIIYWMSRKTYSVLKQRVPVLDTSSSVHNEEPILLAEKPLP